MSAGLHPPSEGSRQYSLLGSVILVAEIRFLLQKLAHRLELTKDSGNFRNFSTGLLRQNCLQYYGTTKEKASTANNQRLPGKYNQNKQKNI